MTTLIVGLCGLMAVGITASAVLHATFARVAPPTERSLEFYEVAYMAGGRSRVAEVALSYLVWAGLVDVRSGAHVIAMVSAPSRQVALQPVEAALVSTIPPDGRSPTMPLAAAREAAGSVEASLEGFVVPARHRIVALAPAVGSAAMAGVVAIGIGLSLDSGWGLLGVIPLIAVIVIATAVLGGNRLTNAGKRALAAERARVAPDLRTAEMGVTSLPIEAGMYIVALHGRAAMTGGLAPLRRVIR